MSLVVGLGLAAELLLVEAVTSVRPPLTAQDPFGSPESAEAAERLAACAAACKDDAESGFAALHESPPENR